MLNKKNYLVIAFIVIVASLFAVSRTEWTETLICFVENPTFLSRSNVKDQIHFIKKAMKKANINGFSNGQRFKDYKGIDYYPNDLGITPLVAACSNDRTDIVGLLIDNGADVNLPSKDGEYPIQRANKNSNQNVVNLLLSSGAWSIQKLSNKQKQKENELIKGFTELPSAGNISSERDVLDIILKGKNYSPNDIKKIEANRDFIEEVEEGYYGLVYEASKCRKQICNNTYMIGGNQLNWTVTTFNCANFIETDIIELYQQIREEILEQYGSPIEDKQVWGDKKYIDDFEKWELAVKNGDLMYICKWQNENKIIGLFVFGLNDKCFCKVIYVREIQNQNMEDVYNSLIRSIF